MPGKGPAAGIAAVAACILICLAPADRARAQRQSATDTIPPPAPAVSDTAAAAPAVSDTASVGTQWSSERIKELLAGETGEPRIEGSSWERRKSPRTAMLCALLVPGLGQIYNEKPLKAAIAMGAEMFYLLRIIDNARRESREADLRDSFPKYVPCGLEGADICLNSDWRYHNAWMEEYKERKIDWVWWSAGTVLVIVLDAYVDAHLHDMRFRLEPAVAPGGGGGLAAVIGF
ncbi:MAG: DUF5683 domain-containing protein [Candidatus Krumholzibacteria bacterium]|nr:DUF5683 domain-containing protein [Candidatus Krumholzibacteria bacterium]